MKIAELDKVERLLSEISCHHPWIEAPEVWATEAKYWSWLRGELRRLWTHYPVRNIFKESRITYVPTYYEDGTPRIWKKGKHKGKPIHRSEIDCSLCGETFVKTKVEMDHMSPAGRCRDGIEACTFLFRLLCPVEQMRPVCKPCHKIHTYAERYGLTFEEAETKKRIIELTKKSIDIQQEELLSFGFDLEDIGKFTKKGKFKGNKAKREACYTKLVKENKL